MMNNEIEKERIDEVLFRFLQSVYLFEQRETELYGVTWDEVYLMQLLIRNQSLTVSELSRKLNTKAFTTSRMISKLNKENLVIRESSTKDKRIVNVAITAQGIKLIKEIENYNYKTIIANIKKLKGMDIHTMMNGIEQLDILLDLDNENQSS